MTQISEVIKKLLLKIGLLKYLRPFYKIIFSFIESIIFRLTAQNTLNKLHSALKSTKIECWLEFGTLLGCYRENGFIKHDGDIDLATSYKNLEVTEKALLSNGFIKKREIKLKSNNVIVEQTFLLGLAQVDIFYVFEENEHFITYDFSSTKELTWQSTIDKFGGLIAYKNSMSPFTLKPINFQGLDFYIPENTELHLKELYGEDFMTPIANWNLDLRPIRKELEDYGVIINK